MSHRSRQNELKHSLTDCRLYSKCTCLGREPKPISLRAFNFPYTIISLAKYLNKLQGSRCVAFWIRTIHFRAFEAQISWLNGLQVMISVCVYTEVYLFLCVSVWGVVPRETVSAVKIAQPMHERYQISDIWVQTCGYAKLLNWKNGQIKPCSLHRAYYNDVVSARKRSIIFLNMFCGPTVRLLRWVVATYMRNQSFIYIHWTRGTS